MPEIPTDDQHATHLGWQRGDIDTGEDHDHLVIDGSFGQPQPAEKAPIISFENPTEDLEQPSETSDQPSFINVDSQGLESPLDLLGSQEPLDDQAVPPLVWFGDDSDGETSFEGTEQQVFS